MISELKEGHVRLKGLITKSDVGKTNKNVPYLNMILEDSSGDLDCKFWNLTEETVKLWKVGMIVEAKGDLILYRNVPQLRIRSLKELPDEKTLDYVRYAPMNGKQMEEEVDVLIENMKDPIIRDVTREVLNMVREDFFAYPAAVRNHHNYPGGLAYHTLSMARIANRVADQYEFLDRDLLISGVILHDLGKVIELSQPVLPEYTPAGNLIGHISLVNNLIDRVAVALEDENSEQVMLMKHMVLSHHGKMEYGSPVMPMIPEAEILSLIDNIDARMAMMENALEQVTPGTFGPRIYALDNRMLYRRKSDKAENSMNEDSENRDEKASSMAAADESSQN